MECIAEIVLENLGPEAYSDWLNKLEARNPENAPLSL